VASKLRQRGARQGAPATPGSSSDQLPGSDHGGSSKLPELGQRPAKDNSDRKPVADLSGGKPVRDYSER